MKPSFVFVLVYPIRPNTPDRFSLHFVLDLATEVGCSKVRAFVSRIKFQTINSQTARSALGSQKLNAFCLAILLYEALEAFLTLCRCHQVQPGIHIQNFGPSTTN
jgi:hypothetical protein